jgi:hypothetical protein
MPPHTTALRRANSNRRSPASASDVGDRRSARDHHRMGGTGHAFISHTKALSPRPGVSDGGYGPPPHPLVARPGQRYWPRRGRRRRGFDVKRVAGEEVVGARVDGNREGVVVTLERLLARREDGQGAHYQLEGYRSRSYSTFAYVHAIGDGEAVLCLPEWHPQRPVSLFPSLIPEPARFPGAWLTLRCDLSAWSAARLEPSSIEPAQDPGPERIARPDLG